MNESLSFTLQASDGLARTAVLTTAHGVIETPAFLTVGSAGAVKGLLPRQLKSLGAQALLMNALHLAWRPGERTVEALGGLHRFSGWDGPILTDSGGYQIFSLPGLRRVTEEGAAFASPVNGEVRLFTPEAVVELQHALGADLIMPLDQCPPYPCPAGELELAVERSVRWLERSVKRHAQLGGRGSGGGYLFGIIQGGGNEKLRSRSLEGSCALPLAGFALGGFCVGEPAGETRAGIEYTAPRMPAERPRYLMGMGFPADILHAVAQGVDLFDCTLPTRNGRNGMAFTRAGPLRLRNARFVRDEKPLDPDCPCYTCRAFSRAFLRHLFLARERNAAILTSLHNVHFYLDLMRGVRQAVQAGRFETHRRAFLSRYEEGAAQSAAE